MATTKKAHHHEAEQNYADDFTHVRTTGELREFLEMLIGNEKPGEQRVCAVDTEADSLHCYEEKLCLIQFAGGGHFAIIDPLSIDDLTPLREYLEQSIVWMHGADFDMRMIKRTFDWIPEKVFDTQTAVRLLGHRKFGLANLVEHFFNVTLSKASQKADWGKRPLSAKMLDYAVNDVRYLLLMGSDFERDLTALGRWDWFVESCNGAREAVLIRQEKDMEDLWKIAGWGKLRPRGLSFLRGLWMWRDEEARLRDRPPFKVLSNDQLMKFSTALQEGDSANLTHRVNRRRVERFREVIETTRAIPESEWPKPPKRVRTQKNPEADARFDKMRAHRDREAAELGIDPTIIASRVTMERIAAVPELKDELLLNWQRNLLTGAL